MFTVQTGKSVAILWDLSVSLANGKFDGALVYRGLKLIGFVEGDKFIADKACVSSDVTDAWWLI